MLTWVYSNLGTILVSLVLVLIVALIIRGMIRDKQKGKSSCGGNCGCCPMGGSCMGVSSHGHAAKETDHV